MKKIINELKRCKIGYFDFSLLKSLGIASKRYGTTRQIKIMSDNNYQACIKISYDSNINKVVYKYAIYNINNDTYSNEIFIGYCNSDDKLNTLNCYAMSIYNSTMDSFLNSGLFDIDNLKVVDYLHN